MGYSAMYTITPESYPTKIRNLGVGAANISARIAAIICPIVTGWLLSTSSGSGTAILVFAGCFLITSLSSLPLRETRPSPITEELLVNS
jgi:putative MFS transporter